MPAGTLHYGNLVNRASPLNRSLALRLQVFPQRGKGNTWFDDSGKHNHGVLTNGPAWGGPMGRPGGFGSLNFDGSDDLVNCGDAPAIGGQTALTIAASIYQRSAGGGTFGRILMKGDFSVFGLSSNTDVTGLAFLIGGGGDVRATGIVTANTWTRVVCRWVSGETNGMRIYVNGAVAVQGTYTGSLVSNTDPIQIGNRVAGVDRGFDGLLDDLKILPGVGWTESQVAEDLNENRRGYPQTINRVRYSTLNSAGAPAGNRRRRVICGAAA